MTFRIEFFSGDQWLTATRCDMPLDAAVKLAREGLVTHNARFAKILDQDSRPVEMVHRDVRP